MRWRVKVGGLLATAPILLDPAALQHIASPTLLFITPLLAGAFVLERFFERGRPGWGELPVTRRSIVAIGVVTTLLYTCIGAYFTASVGPHSGDESHYLLIAKSIYLDHDLDVRNNLANPRESKRRHYHISPASRGGHWYSWHPFGLSLLLAPTVPLGVWARHAVLASFSGLTLAGIATICRMLGARLLWTAPVLLLFGFSTLWGIYSSRALPEVAGASLATWLLVGLLAQPLSPRWSAVLVTVSAIALPWLHTRYVPVSLIGGAWYLFGTLTMAAPGRRRAALICFPALLCLVAGAGYVLVHTHLFEGGSGYPVKSIFSHLFLRGLWHTLGSNIGILATLPLFAWLLAATGVVAARDKEHRRCAVIALTMVLGVLIPFATRWFQIGGSVPGRYLVVVVPLLLPCAAIALHNARWPARIWFFVLGLVSCATFFLMLLRLPLYGRSFTRTTNAMEVVYPVFQGLFHPLQRPAADNWHPIALALYAGTALLLFWSPRGGTTTPAPNRTRMPVADRASFPAGDVR